MFKNAVAVYGKYDSKEDKLNRNLIFRETLSSLSDVQIKIAAADFYKLYVNGIFAGYGPARAAGGYARVDIYDLEKFGSSEENEILIFVSGYACRSLSTVEQDSFIAAEITKNGEPIKYTGRDFVCYENINRVRFVERYSVQRHFGEIYDYTSGDDVKGFPIVELRPIAKQPIFIDRVVPYPRCDVTVNTKYISSGKFSESSDGRQNSGEYGTGVKINAYSFSEESEPGHGFFPADQIEDKPYRYVGSLEKTKLTDGGELPLILSEGEWIMVDFGTIMSGFIRLSLNSLESCDLIVAFSELCESETFVFRAISLESVVEYKLCAGEWRELETFEPYSFKHVAVFVKRGSVEISSVGCRTLERDTSDAKAPVFKKKEHNEIYRSALRTFAHNAVDLLTDCPSRERAGWLCDSFFMGRAEYFFFGKTPVEDAFLQNYVMYKNIGTYPEGVLPMCYPSDPVQNSYYIPQWNMWYIMEVAEYLEQRRPDLDKEQFRPSVMGILNFLVNYENEFGLLERLPSYNFVEWSDANSWTKDVNYPTNFLYSEVLRRVSRVFDIPDLKVKAESVRKKTVEMAFNGELFVDHAKRDKNNDLVNQMHISEACQYYAILYGDIDLDDKKYFKLKHYVINDFADFEAGEYQFCPKNAFIGLYLRMNVLLEMKNSELLARNLENFFLGMSRTTGTLWEFKNGYGSLNHGFASYVALTIPLADGGEI